MNRIKDKIEELENYLQEISEIIPTNFDDYKHDFKIRAACERYFEKIISTIVDLAFLMIKEYRLKIPEEDKQAFDILNENGIISENLKERLMNAKGMRNILAHEYGRTDDELVFESIKNELVSDAEKFIAQIKKFIK